MKHAHLNDMVKGWFVGDFDPTLLRSKDVEVAVKYYKAGDREDTHHRVAVEITAIVSGEVLMTGKRWGAGDIVMVEPGEATDFETITDAVNVVVKMPSAMGENVAMVR